MRASGGKCGCASTAVAMDSVPSTKMRYLLTTRGESHVNTTHLSVATRLRPPPLPYGAAHPRCCRLDPRKALGSSWAQVKGTGHCHSQLWFILGSMCSIRSCCCAWLHLKHTARSKLEVVNAPLVPTRGIGSAGAALATIIVCSHAQERKHSVRRSISTCKRPLPDLWVRARSKALQAHSAAACRPQPS